MKGAAIALFVVGGLLLAGALFFGVYAAKNQGSAERLGAALPKDAGFVVRMVADKSKRQMYYSVALGTGGLVAIGVGLLLKRLRSIAA